MARQDVRHDFSESYQLSQFEAHKQNDLKSVSDSILRINKNAPFCIVDTSKSAQHFAIALKESARALKNTILSLGCLDEQILFHKKTAIASNPSVAIATYIGNIHNHKVVPPFSIRVVSLASPQINKGTYHVDSEPVLLSPNTYSFDLKIKGINYEFQFNINKGDTHEVLLQRLARLINNAGIGLMAYILCDDCGNSALSISSKAVGRSAKGENIFSISDQKTSRASGVVAYLGLNSDITPASNAEFYINDKKQNASVNEFTVEKLFHIILTGTSKNPKDVSVITTKADAESVADNINVFIESYHNFIDTAESYVVTHPQVVKLLYRMKTITNQHLEELKHLGISVDENDRLLLQKDVFLNTVNGLMQKKDLKTTYFIALKDFADAVLSKTNEVQLNPMEFVEKKTVEYKNPEAPNYPCPYISSHYSGMMYNKFC